MDQAGLISQLGIDWKLFLSQAVNFFILLLVLRAFVYKPVLKVVKERNKKIEEGLKKATEADIRLREVDVIAKEKLKQADATSLSMIKSTEERAKKLEHSLVASAEKHQQDLMEKAKILYEKQKEESERIVFEKSKELVKKIIEKTVELRPELIDEALIKKAATHIRTHEL